MHEITLKRIVSIWQEFFGVSHNICVFFFLVVRVRIYLWDRYTKLPLHFLTDFECVAKDALYKEITSCVWLVKLVGYTLILCLLRNIYNICSTFPNKNLLFHPLNMVLWNLYIFCIYVLGQVLSGLLVSSKYYAKIRNCLITFNADIVNCSCQ